MLSTVINWIKTHEITSAVLLVFALPVVFIAAVMLTAISGAISLSSMSGSLSEIRDAVKGDAPAPGPGPGPGPAPAAIDGKRLLTDRCAACHQDGAQPVVRGTAQVYFDPSGTLFPLGADDRQSLVNAMVTGTMPPAKGLNGEALTPLTATEKAAAQVAAQGK